MELTQEELRQKWVEALRSGEFEQCRRKMHQKGDDGVVRHCCLGVAEVVARRCGYVPPHDAVGYELVALAMGLRKDLGEYGDAKDDRALAYDNDDGRTFAEIADIIESKPAGLFVNDGGGTHV